MTPRLDDEARGPLGAKLRALRRSKRLSQAQLAARAGLRRLYVVNLERGAYRNPSLRRLRLLADALESPIESLVSL